MNQPDSPHNRAQSGYGVAWRRLFHPSCFFLKKHWIGMALTTVFLLVACEELPNPFQSPLPPGRAGNLPPETHLFLNFAPDSVDTLITQVTDTNGTVWDTVYNYIRHLPDTTTSRQVLHWWGEDPDGEIAGYYFKWNFQNDWTFTTNETDTFFLPLQIMYDEFSFQVKAMDDSGAVDATPAMITLPVANQPPVIEWAVNANPGVTDPNVEHVTFPTRTFVWTVSDLDGAETISRIRWALDDTTNWNYIAGEATSQTLREIPTGNHTFFVQAIDTAGARSNLLMYPDSADNTTANHWRVREPVGELLLVDDFEDDTGYTRNFYTTILDSLYGVSNYTIFQARGGVKSFPTSITDQTAMFEYFKTIIWYHVNKEPRLSVVDQSLRTFLEKGGNIFVSSLRTDPSYTFTSIDSIKLMSNMRRLSGNLALDFLDPSTTDSIVILPQFELKTESTYTIAYNVYCFWPGLLDFGATAKTLIRLREPRNQFENWTGTPPIAELFQPSPTSGKSVFMSLQFNRFTANNNTYQVMNFILNQVFE